MKKYLFILISFSCFGQFNPVQWYEFGGNSQVNTFIGGVAGTINTRELLATKLGINAGRIKKFEIIGSDIQCAVTGGSYGMTGTFENDSTITYFDDKDGLVSSLNGYNFRATPNLVYVKVKNCTSIAPYCFYGSAIRGNSNDFSSVITIQTYAFGYITPSISTSLSFPSLGNIGVSAFINNTASANNLTVNVPLSFKTSNAGKPNIILTDASNTSVVFSYIGWVDDTSYNTELGGLGTYYENKGLLAAKLGIGSGGIVNIHNIGGNLRFKVLDTYTVANNGFQGNTSITYFDDSIDGLVRGFGILSFENVPNILWMKFFGLVTFNGFRSITNCAKLNNVEMPNMVTFSTNWFGRSCPLLLNVSFLNCTKVITDDAFTNALFDNINLLVCNQIGTTVGDNGVFSGIKTGCTITVPLALQTANSGAPDGDLVYAISNRGATVVYFP